LETSEDAAAKTKKPVDIDPDAPTGPAGESQGEIGLDKSATRTRLAAIEESPDLGRLFRFFIDFRLSESAVLPHLAGRPKCSDGGVLALVRISTDSLTGDLGSNELSRWTLVKFRLDADDKKILSFLPATREELILAHSESCGPDQARSLLHQMDGIYLLGGSAVGVDPTPQAGLAEMAFPAYELVSADLRSAAREIDSRADRLLSAAALGGENPPSSQRQKSGLRSGGLSVVSFSAAPRISRMIGTSQAALGRACDDTFLDAEDLSMGRLPMFGFRVRAAQSEGFSYQWYIQTRKKVTFLKRTIDRRQVDVDRLVAQLYPGDDTPDGPRRLAQASTDRTAPRIFNLAEENNTPILVAAVDAAEVTYLGDPMGVETGLETVSQTLHDQSNELLIDREISLFSVGDGIADDAGVLPLRFGMPVLGGFAAVYLGGGVLTPGEAADRFAEIPEATVPRRVGPTLPQGRRYLRSEPVAAPQVLIPKSEADAEVAAYRKPGGPDFNPQTTGQVVLRTKVDANGKGDTLAPTSLTRVILPPICNLEMAEKHGVFDHVRPKCFPGPSGQYPVDPVERIPLFPAVYHRPGLALRPRDGLRKIHIDSGFGGYPLLRYDLGSTADRTAIIAANFDDGKDWLDRARNWARAVESDPAKLRILPASPAGDAVFAPITAKTVEQGRTIPFYPDPMAARLVIRFRTDQDSLSRDSVARIDLPLVDPRDWPEVTPIALVIGSSRSDRSVIDYTDERIVISGMSCRKVTLNLKTGLSGTVDLWAVPSEAQLSQWSELVDTAASLDCFPGIEGSLVPSLCGCGILGMDAPDQKRLDGVAARLHQELMIHPLPEMSEARSINVVHAASRPTMEATISLNGPGLVLRRTMIGAISEELGAPLLAVRPSELPAAWSSEPRGFNASEADLGGFVSVDLASTSTLEITARAVAPFGDGFDDPSRSRSQEERATGSVAPVFDPKFGTKRRARDIDIYGFSVSPQGAVKLRTSEELWARISNLPSSLVGLSPDKPAWLALHALFGGRSGEIVADIHPLFADARARTVELKFTAIARHSSAFVKRPRIQSGGRVLDDPLPSVESSRTPKEFLTSIWLPASARPSIPVASAQAHPLIAEEVFLDGKEKKITKRRLCEVRLWLERPWFSSGEGEKLGIVLWPRLSRIPSRNILRGLLRTQTLYERPSLDISPASPGEDDYMSLSRFEDRFMTGASRFVTRWGSDATEAFPEKGWRDWVVPYEIFRDFSIDKSRGTIASLRDDAVFVAKASMPIPRTDTQVDTLSAQGEPQRQRYLNVDLLAYEPRFDVDREQWYVDLRLNPAEMVSPFLRLGIVRYQEHAPRDLQVSFPGEAFEFQMLTRRESTVEIKPENDKSLVRVEVSVRGPSTQDKPLKPGGVADASVTTRMNFRLRGIDRQSGLPRLSSEMEVNVSSSGHWSGKFVLPEIALKDPRLHITVDVEERAYRPPTQYPEDFFHPGKEEKDFLIGSPRYSCTFELSQMIAE
jgi:hypothetical protein